MTAIFLALALVEHPASLAAARAQKIPTGILELLRVAVGDDDTLRAARERTGHESAKLRDAATFFIEQVLFQEDANEYQALGCEPNASSAELRQHMALLMRVLHPDLALGKAGTAKIDRSVFAERVTRAWESLKTEKRRRHYDLTLKRERSKEQPSAHTNASKGYLIVKTVSPIQARPRKKTLRASVLRPAPPLAQRHRTSTVPPLNRALRLAPTTTKVAYQSWFQRILSFVKGSR